MDDPLLMDRISLSEPSILRRTRYSLTINEGTFQHAPILSYSQKLANCIIRRKSDNYLDQKDAQAMTEKVINQINRIVPGEFSKTKEGYFYQSKKKNLKFRNLAAGSKQFFMIKQLLLNGYITEGTLLILDEPESRLHPEWINVLAEVLVSIVKETKAHIILTTHNPNLLLGLDVFSRKHKIREKSHFYIARVDDDGDSNIKCIDQNVNDGYAHLSVPLLQMSLLNDKIGH